MYNHNKMHDSIFMVNIINVNFHLFEDKSVLENRLSTNVLHRFPPDNSFTWNALNFATKIYIMESKRSLLNGLS